MTSFAILFRNCGNEATASGSRSLQVNFIDNLSPAVFSGAGIEGEDCSNIQEALVDAHIEKPLSDDGEASSSHSGNVHYPASLPRTAEIGEFDHNQQHYSAPSPDFVSIIFSVGVPSGLDECGLKDLTFPGSMICDTHPMTQAFSGEDCVQDLDTAMHSKNFQLASSSDPETAFEDYLLPPTAIAQMRWTKVFSVLNWFSILKVVICKKKKLGSGKSETQ
jgi:hypothetical protein